jgi:hypothetical protein
LSGTVTATIDGQTPERIYIRIFIDDNDWQAQAWAEEPIVSGSNNWSVRIAPLSQSTTVKFEVNANTENCDDGWGKQVVSITKEVYNADIANIALGEVTLTSGN